MTVRPSRDAGFTLLEVLVALVLTGLVVSAGLGLPKLFARFDQQSQTVAELRDGTAAAGRLLRALAEGAVPDLSTTEEPVQASETALTLLSLGPPILSLDRPAPLTLRVVQGDGHAALRLAWADPETGATREETVLAGARSIRLSYFNPGRPGTAGGWRPDWGRRWALPAAILLRVDAPELGPPIDLIAHTRARLPEACLLLPQEPACRPG
ncbi:general secretion pathway protein J [Inquilinus ginsengisoli]|uniref:General secretion pathway protein J n=1 Tax=Inquilinus ginsengisoli TaxID=363840 RepID=A0ABU1JQH0_9PROT|nr:prepilin-type N-terminal cleavage/methylation domain-containing protein [Inquilinus ginsengisoli]MDR6290872.1 general secretion pathway protein J [Inquilinus ginsengisoli]